MKLAPGQERINSCMPNVANIGLENKGDVCGREIVCTEMPDWMVEASKADAGKGVVPLPEFLDNGKPFLIVKLTIVPSEYLSIFSNNSGQTGLGC
jgi:hypothetical protein